MGRDFLEIFQANVGRFSDQILAEIIRFLEFHQSFKKP
jgi:hypothetical protein